MNESQANQCEVSGRSLTRKVCFRVLWFALIFLLVMGLALYAVGASFPIPGGSELRSGSAAVHESIGVVIMQVIHGPFRWLYSYIDGKAAGFVIWLIWAAVLYFISALMRRPRWVFAP